ncbi:pro-sigmaK processing inhibitor BofA family protein [Bacillus sp. Marseille-P3661]|uniref:pro-sigmaK processing inhibitor BofA family protein n=1 Tax=Bacillus sp. Marseille-P3661 TaxID=1936234 RepID=UPI0027E3DBD3|nr:pro-sigmaK processing inhibitor BofA family protein [Bacillus sp. Marseille-P3661]
MDINMLEPVTIVVMLGGLIGILLILGAPIKPVRVAGQVLVKVMVGALGLFLINSLGMLVDLHVPINLVTAAVSGILGIPGIIALFAIEHMIL